MNKPIIMLLLGAVAIASRAEPELKGTPSELTGYLTGIPRTVSITGESELKIQADRAYVNVKVSTEARSLQDALGKNAALRQRIRDELKKAGIPEQNISGSNFSSRPEYGIFSDKAKSYKVDNTVRVMVADESQFRTVASAIDAHSEASYDGVEFENSKESETKQKVLAQACEGATSKKQLFEDKLGVKLVPQTFTEGQVQKEAPIPPRTIESDYASVPNFKSSVYQANVDGGISQFAELKYRAVVTVQYQVKNQ